MEPDPNRKNAGNMAKQVALAMQIPFSLVVPVFVGGALGYLLDHWLHTKFVFTLVLGFLGFGIGLREVLKMASASDKKNGD